MIGEYKKLYTESLSILRGWKRAIWAKSFCDGLGGRRQQSTQCLLSASAITSSSTSTVSDASEIAHTMYNITYIVIVYYNVIFRIVHLQRMYSFARTSQFYEGTFVRVMCLKASTALHACQIVHCTSYVYWLYTNLYKIWSLIRRYTCVCISHVLLETKMTVFVRYIECTITVITW